MTSTPKGSKLLCIGGPLHGEWVTYGGPAMATVDQRQAMDDALTGAYSPKGVAPVHSYRVLRVTATPVEGREPASRTVYVHSSVSHDQARNALAGMLIDSWVQRTALEPMEPQTLADDKIRIEFQGGRAA
jgi:hypothetical protein